MYQMQTAHIQERDSLSMNNPIVPQTSSTLAYTFGQQDAQAGKTLCPEAIFIQRSQQVDYALGYEAVAGVTVFTAQFTDAEIVAEAEDYEEDMLDREYHARGMW